MIPFNKPFLTGKETHYMYDAVQTGKLSGNGKYTQLCQKFFQEKYGFLKSLLTTSCTDALEMAAILLDIKPGDEVIMPSYTFVSTANAFILRGANIIFADSMKDNPNIDAALIEPLITERTKAIVPVHYAGVACDMGKIMELSKKFNIHVVEDAAQSLDNYYIDNYGSRKALGSIGHLAAFSFHETKNIIAGEGGMLAVNDQAFETRAEIIWEKGTNRSAFFRGDVDKYGWVDVGSSFLPSEIVAAFLYAQLEQISSIQAKRLQIWNQYQKELKHLEDEGFVKLTNIPSYSTNNAHMFYLICKDIDERTRLIDFLRASQIFPVFHYLSLHKSPFYTQRHDGRELPMSDYFTDTLVRLPLFYELEASQVSFITSKINDFFIKKN